MWMNSFRSRLLLDRRGAGTLQMVIIAVGLALGGLVAVKTLGNAAGERTDCAGEQVAAFGGPVPCASDNGGGGGDAQRPPEAPPAPEAKDPPKPEEFDPVKELIDLVGDIIGFNDAKKCITEGDILACIMTITAVSPFKAIGIAIKLAKNAKRIINLVDRFLTARKAKKADDARKAAEEAADASKKCKGGKCDKPGVCFAPGTPVHTERGLVAIEELAAGDLVLSRDDRTGEEAYRPIAQTFVTPDQPLLAVALEDSRGEVETLEVTAPHPFQVEGRGWVEARDLRPDDHVISSGGGRLRVAGSIDAARTTTVYNFEVEEFHTYFVGESAAWVHNDCGSQFSDEDVANLIADSNKNFPLSEANARQILGSGPPGTRARVAGQGGAGGDVEFVDDAGNVVARTEVKNIAGKAQGTFNKEVSHAADQVRGKGDVVVQVPPGRDAERMIARFRGSRPDGTAEYADVRIRIIDDQGNVLYDGPLGVP